jgi:hypothetical protein
LPRRATCACRPATGGPYPNGARHAFLAKKVEYEQAFGGAASAFERAVEIVGAAPNGGERLHRSR